LGATLIQGYWFAKPMPAEQVPDWLYAFEGRSAKTETALIHKHNEREKST